jgi:capsular exopolysaccharide synthesis family protein
MVTSAGRGEGKSTIAGLLAVVAARIFHRRTLIIDSDLRRPSLHHLLACTERPGLFEVIHETAPIEAALRATSIPTLTAMLSGKVAGPLSEAYDDERFSAILKDVRSRYDLIVVDAAPIVPVIEPLLIAEHVDGVLLVAMAGKTPVPMVRRMRQILGPIESKVMGAILNNATEGLPYYYDYRYYGYEPPATRRIRARGEREPKPDPRARHAARQREAL